MPSSVSVCPFAVTLFVATAVAVVVSKKKAASSKKQKTAVDAELPQCQVVFVLGAPGTGKGTQCELLSKRLCPEKWIHLSAGDLLRAERNKNDSALGQEINACIAAGQLVDSKITCRLLQQAMQEAYCKDSTSTRFLIDGFPRSKANAQAWQDTMQKHKVCFVLDFCCPRDTLIGRLLQRERTDDNLETIQKRFDTFEKETAPILAYYQNENTDIPVYKIATDKPVEQVYQATVKYFQ